jgi:hypothetical protein
LRVGRSRSEWRASQRKCSVCTLTQSTLRVCNAQTGSWGERSTASDSLRIAGNQGMIERMGPRERQTSDAGATSIGIPTAAKRTDVPRGAAATDVHATDQRIVGQALRFAHCLYRQLSRRRSGRRTPGRCSPAVRLPPRRLNWPNSARFNAVAGRRTQDHAGPFCTMKARLARDFFANWSLDPRCLPRRRFLRTLK